MSNQLPKDTQQPKTPTGVPLQRISWSEKVANDHAWFKQNLDYRLSISNFNLSSAPENRKDLRTNYMVYNNQFPLEWFDHITNPLNATDPKHKKFPAKIRPTSMLRTNIDLLLGEYAKRPFSFQVSNMGEDAYNSRLEALTGKIESNLQEHFLAVAQQQMQAAGHSFQQIPQDDQVEMPDSVKERFQASYKDNLAIRGQRWMKRAIREYQIRQKLLKLFKDWLIAGRVFSYKNIVNGNLIYERVPVMELGFDRSPNDSDFIEDSEWCVRRSMRTVSDVVDDYYDELTEKDHQVLESTPYWASPAAMYNYLNQQFSGDPNQPTMGKVPVYHVCWKGKKEVKYVTYTDPLTQEVHEDVILDEDTPIDSTMKVTKSEWLNEVYEATLLGGVGQGGIYVRMRPVPVQRNEMNNFSACKLPYNGRFFSDTHSEAISVLDMGIPCAILYMIANFALERTIAKNKGKVQFFDINAIPKKNGWNEEKFLYYADALGWAFIDRNQIGVDKSYNQYATADMSLFGDIEKLIALRDSFKKDWDDVLGITPPRKGESAPNMDGLGVQQNSLFQSSTITDMIFTLFEEFIQSELQGFLDYSKFVNREGTRAFYNSDDFDEELLSIDPNSYCDADLGLFVNFSAQELQTLLQYKNQTQAMIQNGVKQSTILEIQKATSVEELMMKLKQIEEIELQQVQASEQSEHEKAMEIEGIKEQYLHTQSMLKIDQINAEWDRKDQNTIIQGEYQVAASANAASEGDVNQNGIPDADEIANRALEAQKILADNRRAQDEIASREKMQSKQQSHEKEMQDKELAHKTKELAAKKQIEDKKAKVAAIKKKTTPKK
jgi:hypothetical protein